MCGPARARARPTMHGPQRRVILCDNLLRRQRHATSTAPWCPVHRARVDGGPVGTRLAQVVQRHATVLCRRARDHGGYDYSQVPRW